MEKAILVTVVSRGEKDKLQTYSNELELLAKTAGVETIRSIGFDIDRPTAAYYISKGKLELIREAVEELEPDVVVFGINLKANQQRNIEDILNVKTIDYTQLILDIFARHARTMEGKMQVELAQLQYLLPRLSGRGIMLSRLGGGIGTRGPGETKLEVDRRRIMQRVSRLKKELARYRDHRSRIRSARKRRGASQISLVGYTSAGKTTLINALASANQRVSKELFTTLDPILRKVRLPDGRYVVISDTVGFIDRLPHTLVEAFKATLEEVVSSDLLLVVLDGSDVDWRRKRNAVFDVLEEIGAREKPIITVVNKIDIADSSILSEISLRAANPVFVSALTGEGIDALLEKIAELLVPHLPYNKLLIPYGDVGLLNYIYENGKVVKREDREDGIYVEGWFDLKEGLGTG